MTKLSIITVNLNNRNGLQSTIESVLNQSVNDFEYIIIDGASTDGSINLIKEYESRLAYWISEPDKGVYCAMNKGIDKAKGDYCLFINSGDTLIDSECLNALYQNNSDEDIIYGDFKLEEKIIKSLDQITLYSLLNGGYLPHPATLIKRSLFDSCGKYNETYKVTSDWEFWIKAIIYKNCSYKHVNRVIAQVEPAGLSSYVDPEEIESLLNSLFPKRILPDYERLKKLEEIHKNNTLIWINENPGVLRFARFFYRFSKGLNRT